MTPAGRQAAKPMRSDRTPTGRPLPSDAPRAVVTRPAHTTEGLADALARRGLRPVRCPLINIAPPSNPQQLREALTRWGDWDWVVFTSRNAVRAVVEARTELDRTELDRTEPDRTEPDRTLPVGPTGAWGDSGPQIAAVGPKTAKALADAGLAVDAMPSVYDADHLAACLGDLSDATVLLPRSAIGRDTIVDRLEAAGAEVWDVTAYLTEARTPTPDELADLGRGFAVLTLASPSAADAFARHVAPHLPAAVAEAYAVACIGPTTASEAEALGLPRVTVAETHTVEGLADVAARAVAALAP